MSFMEWELSSWTLKTQNHSFNLYTLYGKMRFKGAKAMPSKIIKDLQAFAVAIDTVLQHDNNPMEHPDPNLEAIAKSLDTYGQRRPIVVNRTNNKIEAGNGTCRAAKQILGWDEIAAIFVDDDPDTEIGFAIADNRTAQLSKWNWEVLGDIFKNIDNPDNIPGVNRAFISDVLDRMRHAKRMAGEGIPENGNADAWQDKWQVELGQLWIIPSLTMPGKSHRLLCGNSTDPLAVEFLMNGEKGSLFATDPPYGKNAAVSSLTADIEHTESIDSDDLDGPELQAFLEQTFQTWLPYIGPKSGWYIWHGSITAQWFLTALANCGILVSRQIIWRKDNFIIGRGHYHWGHEPCFYGWIKGQMPEFYGERNQSTVWEISRHGTKRAEVGHPMAWPLDVWITPMRNHTLDGDICLEPFSGSGSQLEAGEITGRRVYAMELSPRYVSVALERLSKLGCVPELAGEKLNGQ